MASRYEAASYGEALPTAPFGGPRIPPALTSHPGDSHPSRWRMLALLCVAELLGMSLWFGASSVAPMLAAGWALGPSQSGWLAKIVQLGVVVGTAAAAVLNVADLVPARILFAACALAGAAVNAGLP